MPIVLGFQWDMEDLMQLFIATSQEDKKIMPERIIGVTMDSNGKLSLWMAMQLMVET